MLNPINGLPEGLGVHRPSVSDAAEVRDGDLVVPVLHRYDSRARHWFPHVDAAQQLQNRREQQQTVGQRSWHFRKEQEVAAYLEILQREASN